MAQFRMDIALMCKLFIEAPSSLWVSKSRSIRIQKHVTSIKLESYYWTVLEEIATRDSLTIPSMVNRLYSESIEAGHDLGNFTSFLRVCAVRYLALQATGDIPSDTNISIASLDADKILATEAKRVNH